MFNRLLILKLLLILGLLVTAISTRGATSEEWLEKIEATDDQKQKAAYYLDLAKENLHDPEQAIKYANEGIKIARSVHDNLGVSNLLNLIGVAYWQLGDLEKSIQNYEKSLEFLPQGSNHAERSNLMGNIGLAYVSLGEFDKALDYQYQCRELRKQLGDKQGVLNVSLNIGAVYYYKGQYEDAIATLISAAELSRKLEDEDTLSGCCNNIGAIYLELDNLEKAKSYFQESLQIDKRRNNTEGMAYALGNLANIDLKREMFQDAILKFQQVIQLESGLSNRSKAELAHNGLGDAYRGIENFDQAILHYEEALKLNDASNDKNAKAVTLISLSELHVILGDKALTETDAIECWKTSIDYANQALSTAQSIESLNQLMKSHLQLYEGFRRLKDFENALSHHVSYQNIQAQLFDSEKHRQIAELESKYQLVNKTREIENLQANNKIQELELKDQSQRVANQRRLMALIASISILLLLIAFIYTQLIRTRQKFEKNELVIQNLITEQKLLRSQMNPHFIYNSLNSIQAFISSNESYQAEKYLAKFAKLMRGILENSFHEFVPFTKEMDVIRTYLELEQLRFEGRFQFKIEWDEDFDESFISIPPMIIQPFLENAILHGFKQVNNGMLSLVFSETPEAIRCIIDDNGIGREQAGALNRQVDKKSLATYITNRRLQSSNSKSDLSGSLVIIDKVDKTTGKSCGTRVELSIPFVVTNAKTV